MMENKEAFEKIKNLIEANNYGNPTIIKRRIVEICEDQIKKELDRPSQNKSIKNI